MSLNNIVSACGAVGSAVVGGIYTNFSARVMPWLGSLPDAEAIETMQKFNRTAVQVPFTTFFFGTAIASTWTVVHNVRKTDRSIGDQISATGGGGLGADYRLQRSAQQPPGRRRSGDC